MKLHSGLRRYVAIAVFVAGGVLMFAAGYLEQISIDAGQAADYTALTVADAILYGAAIAIGIRFPAR